MRIALAAAVALGIATLVPPAVDAQEPNAEALYREHCRTCHGVAGVPPQRMLRLYPNLRALDSTFLATRPVDSLVAATQNGVGRDMKSFQEKMTPEQIRAVAEYVKAFARPAPQEP